MTPTMFLFYIFFLNLLSPSFVFPYNSVSLTTGFQEFRVENVGQTHSNADQVEAELTVVQFPNPKIMTTQGFLGKFLA